MTNLETIAEAFQGLANEIDANPRMWDGDFFGTGVGWLNANCAGVLSAATNGLGEMEISWRTNANPNAYYWLDLTATGALGGFVENIYMKDCSVEVRVTRIRFRGKSEVK